MKKNKVATPLMKLALMALAAAMLILATVMITKCVCIQQAKTEVIAVLQSSARGAYDCFESVESINDYWNGVAFVEMLSHLTQQFRSIVETELDYELAVRSTNGLLYWMIESPQEVMAEREKLLMGLELLAKNACDHNAYSVLYDIFLNLEMRKES